MLRHVRLRLCSASYQLASRRLQSSAAVSYAAAEEEEEQVHGTDYGAGPSRIPYEYRSSPSTGRQRARLSASSSFSPRPLPTSPAEANRRSAQAIRHALLDLPRHLQTLPGRKESPYASMENLRSVLGLETPLYNLTRLEQHVIIHHLIRRRHKRHGPLISRIIHDAIMHGRNARPQQRRTFAYKTLVALLRNPRQFGLLQSSFGRSPRAPPADKPTIADQQPCPPSRGIASLLDLLESLQNVRNRRPFDLYWLIIRECVEEGLPDVAAKVYVGMVEEWIVEGRVAEGLDPDQDFHEGGGPPRNTSPVAMQDERWTLRVELRKLYWKTVRCWVLPGEVLSPHDRLDLWHPRNQALGEKLRSFPYPNPQSPPMLVPQPHHRLLSMILSLLELDPEVASPTDFAASMRACAMLANTILNRTLPILSQVEVLEALGNTPRHPPVYPETMTEPPPALNAWAYEAYTHVHLALQSLFFNLPVHSEWVRFIQAAEHAKYNGLPLPPPPEPRMLYMLPPLCYRACLTMVKYGLRRLRRPQILGKVLEHARRAYGKVFSPALYNLLLRGTSLIRDNKAADKVDRILFGNTKLAKREITDGRFGKARNEQSHTDRGQIDGQRSLNLVIPAPQVGIKPNFESLLALILHLTATSQFDRLEAATYQLIPFLAFSRSMTAEQLETGPKEMSVEPGIAFRPRPQPLPMALYGSILVGLEKAGRSALASRVIHLANQAESELVTDHLSRYPDVPIPASFRLTIVPFTTMILVWDNEVRSARSRHRRDSTREEWPRGWSLPEGHGRLPRKVAAELMVVHTYEMARTRWQGRQDFRPDVKFFNAMVQACTHRWRLDTDTELVAGRYRMEVDRLVSDMRRYDIPVPPLLEAKLGTREFPPSDISRSDWFRLARNEFRESRKTLDFIQQNRELRRLADMQAEVEDGVMIWPVEGDKENEEDELGDHHLKEGSVSRSGGMRIAG